MFCMKCGQSIPDGSKICMNCGFDIEEAMKSSNSKATTNTPLNYQFTNHGATKQKPKKKTNGCLVAVLLGLIAILLTLIIGAISGSKKVKSAEWEMDSVLVESEQDTEVYINVNIPSDGEDVEKSDVKFDIDNPSICGIEFTEFNKNAVKCTIIPHSNGVTGITATVQGKKTHSMNVSISMEKLEKPLNKTTESQTDSQADDQNNKTTSAQETQTETEPPETNTVIYDDNGILITYKGIEFGDTFGPELKLLIENNSDKPYIVQVRDFSVNGYMIDTLFSSDVAAGKKINDDITITQWNLDENGIANDQIEDIEFSFHIFNSDDWVDSFDSGIISISITKQ